MAKMTKTKFMNIMSDEGYSFRELEYLFYTVCKADGKVRRWVMEWLLGKGYPDERIEGVTVEELVQKQGLKPLNAFIVMDWLIKDPDAAKYSLTRPHLSLEISEETKQEILEAVKLPDSISDEAWQREGGQDEEISED